jgi:periplasmic divalent cation tolerance protein
MTPVLLYITTTDKPEASRIARMLLEERHIACANILPGAASMYWWQGAIQEQAECVLIAKSISSHVQTIIDRVKAVHSNTCPCVVAVPITHGYHEFLDWIVQETKAV